MCINQKTSFIKVQVLNSHDGEYRGVSFNGINPEAVDYFHCNSIEEAFALKEKIDKFVDEQIKNICPNPW